MVRAGAVIGFRIDEDRVRFEVNLTRAEQNHLKISAQLLKVAMTVSGTQVGPSGR